MVLQPLGYKPALKDLSDTRSRASSGKAIKVHSYLLYVINIFIQHMFAEHLLYAKLCGQQRGDLESWAAWGHLWVHRPEGGVTGRSSAGGATFLNIRVRTGHEPSSCDAVSPEETGSGS